MHSQHVTLLGKGCAVASGTNLLGNSHGALVVVVVVVVSCWIFVFVVAVVVVVVDQTDRQTDRQTDMEMTNLTIVVLVVHNDRSAWSRLPSQAVLCSCVLLAIPP